MYTSRKSSTTLVQTKVIQAMSMETQQSVEECMSCEKQGDIGSRYPVFGRGP